MTASCRFILIACGEFLILAQPPQESDVILVLAGDFWGNRVLTGAELGTRGYAKRVVISGTPYQNTFESDLAIQFAESKGYSRDLFISAHHHARSTIEEALAIEPELHRLGARRVTLVTADYHSRRAALVFSLFLSGFQFRSVPAQSGHFQPRSWWTTGPGCRLVLSEWLKLIGTLVIKAGSLMIPV